MKIRAKISFTALEKRYTILELFCQTILKCYNKLILHGVYEQPSEEQKLWDQQVEELLNYSQFRGVIKGLILYNQSKSEDEDVLGLIASYNKLNDNFENDPKKKEAAEISQLVDKTRCIDLFRNLQNL